MALQVIQSTIRKYPSTVLIPLTVLCVVCGLGVFGVMSGVALNNSNRRSEATQTAAAMLNSFKTTVEQVCAGRSRGRGHSPG